MLPLKKTIDSNPLNLKQINEILLKTIYFVLLHLTDISPNVVSHGLGFLTRYVVIVEHSYK